MTLSCQDRKTFSVLEELQNVRIVESNSGTGAIWLEHISVWILLLIPIKKLGQKQRLEIFERVLIMVLFKANK